MSLAATLYTLFLVVSLAMGVVASRRVRGLRDFYIAGGQMPWYLLCGTFIASNVSAGLFLGGTNMTGRHGYTLWCSYATTSIGYVFAIGVVGVMVKRLAANHDLYDFADVLAARYPSRRNGIRVFSAIILPIIYIPTLAAQFIGLSAISASLYDFPYEAVLVLTLGVVVLYTLLGGMIGVVWTDTFQFFVLFVGLIVAVPMGLSVLGDGDAGQGWVTLTSIDPDLFKWKTAEWHGYEILGQFVWVFALGSQPHLVTRFLTAKDEKTIIKALPVCAIAGIVIYSATVPVGLLGRVALEAHGGEQHYYIAMAKHTLGPWLGTFTLIGVAAAALSSCSTILMVTAQAISRDVYERWRGYKVDDAHLVRVSRISVLLIGVLAGVLAYFRPLSIFWLVVLSASLFSAIFFIPLVGGFFSTRATGRGALAAMITGAVTAPVIYAVNKSTGSYWFASEFIGGMLFSLLVFLWFNYRDKPTPAERAVIAGMAR